MFVRLYSSISHIGHRHIITGTAATEDGAKGDAVGDGDGETKYSALTTLKVI
jgi:hypothetical protein